MAEANRHEVATDMELQGYRDLVADSTWDSGVMHHTRKSNGSRACPHIVRNFNSNLMGLLKISQARLSSCDTIGCSAATAL